MVTTYKLWSSGLAVLGRVIGSAVSGAAVLASTWLTLIVAGLFRVTTIQVVTMQPYDSVRRSFYLFGRAFEQGDFPFRIFCALFVLPSMAAAFLVWVHLGRRWRTRTPDMKNSFVK